MLTPHHLRELTDLLGVDGWSLAVQQRSTSTTYRAAWTRDGRTHRASAATPWGLVEAVRRAETT